MMSILSNAKFLIWLAVPLSLWGATETFGLPHIRWSYSWLDEGQGHDPFADRYYTDCTFWGPFGTFAIHPSDGNCAWVQLFKKTGGG